MALQLYFLNYFLIYWNGNIAFGQFSTVFKAYSSVGMTFKLLLILIIIFKGKGVSLDSPEQFVRPLNCSTIKCCQNLDCGKFWPFFKACSSVAEVVLLLLTVFIIFKVKGFTLNSLERFGKPNIYIFILFSGNVILKSGFQIRLELADL